MHTEGKDTPDASVQNSLYPCDHVKAIQTEGAMALLGGTRWHAQWNEEWDASRYGVTNDTVL